MTVSRALNVTVLGRNRLGSSTYRICVNLFHNTSTTYLTDHVDKRIMLLRTHILITENSYLSHIL